MSNQNRWSLWLLLILVVLSIVLSSETNIGRSQVPTATPTPSTSPTPDLNGRWRASGDGVGEGGVVQIVHRGNRVTATFISGGKCPVGTRTLYFEGTLRGNELSGTTYNFCGDKSMVEECGRPPFQPTTFKATANRNEISGRFRELWEAGYMKDGKLDCPTFKRYPPWDKDVSLRLTRETPLPDPEQPDPDDRTDPENQRCCNEARTALEGKLRIKTLYEQASRNPNLRTFSDVQRWVIARAGGNPDFRSPNRFHLPGALRFISYTGCAAQSGGTPAVPDRSCELNLAPECADSECEILAEVCRQHERGHITDLTAAFSLFKAGTWTVRRWANYINGTSTIRADVRRRIQNEIDLYTRDIELLRSWVAACEN